MLSRRSETVTRGFTLTELLVFVLLTVTVGWFWMPTLYSPRMQENEKGATEVLAMMKSSHLYWLQFQDIPLTMALLEEIPVKDSYSLMPFLRRNSSGIYRFNGFDFDIEGDGIDIVGLATPSFAEYSGQSLLRLSFATSDFLVD